MEMGEIGIGKTYSSTPIETLDPTGTSVFGESGGTPSSGTWTPWHIIHLDAQNCCM